MTTLQAICRGLCPRCRQGRIFASLMKMNARCPECSLVFDREPGYFLGAMMISYGMSVACYGVIYLLLKKVSSQPVPILCLEMFVLYLPVIPVVFRYSRIAWIYFDQAVDPAGK